MWPGLLLYWQSCELLFPLSDLIPVSRSRALPGNALSARLCLAGTTFGRRQNGRQSLPSSAFPGRAWERGLAHYFACNLLHVAVAPLDARHVVLHHPAAA